MMCRFHVILLSRIMPRYLTESLFGIGILIFMVTCGQDCFRSVKVIWLDLFLFILKRHLCNHFSIESRPRWEVEEELLGLSAMLIKLYHQQMLLWLSLLKLVNRQCRWWTAEVREHLVYVSFYWKCLYNIKQKKLCVYYFLIKQKKPFGQPNNYIYVYNCSIKFRNQIFKSVYTLFSPEIDFYIFQITSSPYIISFHH